MNLKALAGLVLVVAALAPTASAQTFSARRMGMGGVVLGGGFGGDAGNVAYRAVPPPPATPLAIPLPIGLIPVLADPPTLDPDDPDFNVYRVADLLYNPPWNLRLGGPTEPSSDVIVRIAKDRLAVDLGEVRDVFPEDESRSGGVANGPAAGFGIRGAFVAVAPLLHYENRLALSDALRGALRDGDAFLPNTEYALFDNARGQAALGLHLGVALPLFQSGPPRAPGGMGLYGGLRIKLMRGMAYGDAGNVLAFTTDSVLFNDPVDVRYTGAYRTAGPDGGRFGRGLDLGAVWLAGPAEIGLGVNDVGTRFDWKVRERRVERDPATGEYVETLVRDDVAFRSRVPTTYTANAAVRVGRWLLAGDVVRGANDTEEHLGAETWIANVAVRAGAALDGELRPQFACGTGMRFGPVGLDLALASHSRSVTRRRSLELGAGLAIHR